jgi:hypothetical protein
MGIRWTVIRLIRLHCDLLRRGASDSKTHGGRQNADSQHKPLTEPSPIRYCHQTLTGKGREYSERSRSINQG